jgi:hypothetical protein
MAARVTARAGRPRSQRGVSIAAACVLSVVMSPAYAPAQLMVAWDTDGGASGRARVVHARSPWSLRRSAHDVGVHAVLAPGPRGQVLSLSVSAPQA